MGTPQAKPPNSAPSDMLSHESPKSSTPTRDRMRCMANIYTSLKYHTMRRSTRRWVSLKATNLQSDSTWISNHEYGQCQNVCLARLCKMEILVITNYINPLDIGSSSIITNWVGFIKMHLKHSHVNGMALLQGNFALALE